MRVGHSRRGDYLAWTVAESEWGPFRVFVLFTSFRFAQSKYSGSELAFPRSSLQVRYTLRNFLTSAQTCITPARRYVARCEYLPLKLNTGPHCSMPLCRCMLKVGNMPHNVNVAPLLSSFQLTYQVAKSTSKSDGQSHGHNESKHALCVKKYAYN